MTTKLNAVYLGNTDEEYCGFTVGKEYEVDIYNYENDYIATFDDDGVCRHVKNGAFHKFGLPNDGDFVTETECAVGASDIEEKAELRYYINGHEVGAVEFANVRDKVLELDDGGVKCDSIKFEVKFE